MVGFLNSNSQPLSFGQSPQTSSGFQIGQTSSSGLGFSFGASQPTATAAVAPFGAITSSVPSSAPATSGFSLGQQSTSTSGFSFGLGGNTTLSSGLFGPTSNTSSSGTAGFFSQSQSNAPVSSTPSFGLGSTSSSGLFGQSAPCISSTGFNLGQNSSSSTSTSTPGLFSITSNQTTQATPGLNFGLTPTVSTSSSTGFNFPASTSAASTTGFSLGTANTGLGGTSLFSNTGTSTTSIGLGGGSFPSSSTSGLGGATSSGLGGLPTAIADGSGSSLTGKTDKTAKEAPLPQDIFSTISLFESHKDTEKKCSEDNVRQTVAPFHKLVEDTKKLRQHILKLSNQHIQLKANTRKLKASVIQEAENVEMARRTQDMPMSLQGNNNAPEQFFLRLVRSFEERMTFCRNKIEEVEKCARNGNNVSDISPEDIKEILRKEHNMVKMLAAKIYALRNQLISHINHSAHPEFQPEAVFKVASRDPPLLSLTNKSSNIARPALGDTGSGLLEFQSGQQRAKAVALGASPPNLPLSLSSMPNLLGSTNQSGIFSSTIPAFGTTSLNFGSANSSFNIGNKSSFNTFNTNTGGTLFGNQPTGGMFGTTFISPFTSKRSKKS